ncbi:hypothetical protein [Streptomyces sp. NPDC050145]|uniref:hypothetical protein n=1 Tax=Streptomyces sp. NPDC050145 TaxID=3365602 RepID=UPI0037AEFA60
MTVRRHRTVSAAPPHHEHEHEPLSVRRLLALCAAVSGSAVLVVLLVDGLAAAGAFVCVLVTAALAGARYVLGAQSLDPRLRDEVRLLRSRSPGMGEWRRHVRGATGPDGALYYRTTLRPQLRRLFAAALAEHHHVSLDHQPERAAALIGPELWPWLGADPPPADGHPGGVPPDVLHRLTDRLEALGAPRTRTGSRTREKEAK